MTSRRTARYGTLLSVVLALFLTMALAACTDDGDPGGEGTPGSLLERATEREATQEAGPSATETPTGSQSLFGRATPGPTEEGESSANGPTPESTVSVELDPCSPRALTLPRSTETSAETDRDALVAIFEATDGPSWDESGDWGGRKPIGEWAGVGAGGAAPAGVPVPTPTLGQSPPVPDPRLAGRVTSLELTGLTGELPLELGDLTALEHLSIAGSQLTGHLPPELANLVNLRSLSISGGQLTGPIPPELGNLTKLETLNLEGTQLCGKIPSELGGLESLQSLNLGGNQLVGKIPPELGGLGSLQSLNLESNQLTGKIPPELGGLGSLQSLNLESNQLTGKIPPELGGLGSLQSLNLESNQLTGKIPPELGGLGSLQSLNLESNQLTGDIPPELDNLVSTLREIRFDGNQLRCISNLLSDGANYAGEVPICIVEDHPGDTEALIALYNAWGEPGLRNWLSREPIGEWEGVSVDSNGRVAALNLAGKRLSGEIAPEVGNLESLQVLNLRGNQLDRGVAAGGGQPGKPASSGPVRQPADRGVAAGGGQPPKPANSGPVQQPVERADTAGVGESGQPGSQLPENRAVQVVGGSRRRLRQSVP